MRRFAIPLLAALMIFSTEAPAAPANLFCYDIANLRWVGCSSTVPIPTVRNGTGGQNPVTVTNASGEILAARTAPQTALSVKNESASASIAICFGACTAALNTAGSITIAPGQLWSASSTYVPLDSIKGISSEASSPATIQAN